MPAQGCFKISLWWCNGVVLASMRIHIHIAFDILLIKPFLVEIILTDICLSLLSHCNVLHCIIVKSYSSVVDFFSKHLMEDSSAR